MECQQKLCPDLMINPVSHPLHPCLSIFQSSNLPLNSHRRQVLLLSNDARERTSTRLSYWKSSQRSNASLHSALWSLWHPWLGERDIYFKVMGKWCQSVRLRLEFQSFHYFCGEISRDPRALVSSTHMWHNILCISRALSPSALDHNLLRDAIHLFSWRPRTINRWSQKEREMRDVPDNIFMATSTLGPSNISVYQKKSKYFSHCTRFSEYRVLFGPSEWSDRTTKMHWPEAFIGL